MFLQVSANETHLRQDPQLESKFQLYVVSTLVNIVSRINQLKCNLMSKIVKYGKMFVE